MTNCSDIAIQLASIVANETLFPSRSLLYSIFRLIELVKVFIEQKDPEFDVKGSCMILIPC